jgi:hypothetical protein
MKTLLIYGLILAAGTVFCEASLEEELQRAVDPVPMAELPASDKSGKVFVVRDYLCLGKFEAASVEEALEKSFFDESTVIPHEGDETAGKVWIRHRGKGERVYVRQIRLDQGVGAFAVYFSYWIYSPVETESFSTRFYAGSMAKFFVNGAELEPSSVSNPKDDHVQRRVYTFKSVFLKQGWNRFLIKLAGIPPELRNDEMQEATLAIRIGSSKSEVLAELVFSADITQ